jgi:hypothetical protein
VHENVEGHVEVIQGSVERVFDTVGRAGNGQGEREHVHAMSCHGMACFDQLMMNFVYHSLSLVFGMVERGQWSTEDGLMVMV